MKQVTVSRKYQVTIPKEARRQASIRAGQKLMVVVKDGSIILVPMRPLSQMRGFLRGMSRTINREK